MLVWLCHLTQPHKHINGETVHIVHAPNAHTDGDSFVHFANANALHAGDLFFNGFFPVIDGVYGGSLRGMIEAADAMLALCDDSTKIIPGHGPLATAADLRAYRNMLATVYERLLTLKNQGLTAEEMVAQKPLADLDADWGKAIFNADRWIATIYPAVY